ncbi:SEC12-like protein 2 isoform X2 [Raphanus sativus]|uniref:SEC12-like protein 2 isoform X2 n=1 Tax=Raphanus sativus TaxID=3726 RepID=A0A9W3DHM4_RAPSA|nr:SEC12-like protein 2 isoform X2 [Raphanus sativus]
MANTQTYGFPIYAADWIPEETVRSKIDKDKENSKDGSESSSSSSSRSCIVLAGGGGEGRSGIPNVIVICRVDLESNSLSEQPVGRVVVTGGLPYRMAVHPSEGILICALPESCKRFDLENIMRPREGVELEEVVNELEDVGLQLALAFNQEGSVLAAGGEDGTSRIFEWPSMKTLLNESKAHAEVKNLTFSESGKFLVSLGGPLCRVWDVNASTAVASLSKEKDEMFASCRFSVDNAGNEVLYIAAKTERGGSIITWDTTSWKRRHSKLLKNYSISAFNVSPDGRFLALCLVSVSIDSRAKLTVIEQKAETNGIDWPVVVLMFVLLLVVSYYFLMVKGIIGEE